MNNSLVFDELNILKNIETAILTAFNTAEWFSLFGERDMRIIKENSGLETQFPLTVVEIINCTPTKRNNTEIEEYTQFDLEINQYNQAVGENDKRTLGIMINNKTKEILQKQFLLTITSNNSVSAQDSTIYRRVIRGTGIINNRTNTLFKA